MTYSVNVSGSYTNLEDESAIEAAAREFVDKLDQVSSATLTTTHGGSVNLLNATGAAPDTTAPAAAETTTNVGTTETPVDPRADFDPSPTTSDSPTADSEYEALTGEHQPEDVTE